MQSTLAATHVDAHGRLTLTIMKMDPAGVRELLKQAVEAYSEVLVDLSWLQHLPLSLFEVLSSAELKARSAGTRLEILCSESLFQSLVRMGWADDFLKVRKAPVADRRAA